MKLRWRKIGNKNLFARGNNIRRTQILLFTVEEKNEDNLAGEEKEKGRDYG